MAKWHYEVYANWITENGDFVNRFETTTRKRDAIAMASDMWNEKIKYWPAEWTCKPTVVKVMDDSILESWKLINSGITKVM